LGQEQNLPPWKKNNFFRKRCSTKSTQELAADQSQNIISQQAQEGGSSKGSVVMISLAAFPVVLFSSLSQEIALNQSICAL